METPKSPPVSQTDLLADDAASPLGLSRSAWRWALVLITLLALAILGSSLQADTLSGRIQTFVTVFLGIFIEAVPFLVAGSIVSGLIEVFVNRDLLFRFIPRNPVLAAIVGSGLGIVFPVCECGVVPVTRRLYQKGLPLSMGVAFLLAAPVINPIVFASTYAAFGWGPMLWGRFALTFAIAAVVGLMFYIARADEVLLPARVQLTPQPVTLHLDSDSQPTNRLWQALAMGADDFLDMARYLVLGSLLAAAMQTLVPQPLLLALGSGAVTSVVAMMALAFILSICSTVDAFLALAFVNTFTPASILAFLTFGPMVDIKSALMFLSVFRRRTVLYLILLPLMINLVVAIFLNYNVGW